MASIPASSPDREIVSTRTFDASPALVFKAWTDPEHLKNWWGPAGFTNTFHEFDLRPGGRWRFTMHGPGKGNYPNEVEFIAVEKPLFIHWQRISKPLFQIAATFDDIGGKTKLVFRMIFDTPQERDKLKPYVVDKNEENFDKLENELAKMAL